MRRAACWTIRFAGTPGPDHAGYRMLVVAGYRILYQLRPDTGDQRKAGDVGIVRVFGPGQLAVLP